MLSVGKVCAFIGVLCAGNVAVMCFTSDDSRVPQIEFTLFEDENTPCGPLAVSIVGRFLGANVLLEKARELVPTSEAGESSLDALSNGLAQAGLASSGVRTDCRQLMRVETPVILHLFGNHFAAAIPLRRNRIMIIDPPNEVAICNCEQLSRMWDGIVLLVAANGPELDRELNRIGARQ